MKMLTRPESGLFYTANYLRKTVKKKRILTNCNLFSHLPGFIRLQNFLVIKLLLAKLSTT